VCDLFCAEMEKKWKEESGASSGAASAASAAELERLNAVVTQLNDKLSAAAGTIKVRVVCAVSWGQNSIDFICVQSLTEAKARAETEIKALRDKSDDVRAVMEYVRHRVAMPDVLVWCGVGLQHAVLELSFKLSAKEQELSAKDAECKRQAEELLQKKAIIERLAKENISMKKCECLSVCLPCPCARSRSSSV
jgi:hypothetical protein